eukprot:CAMPEP_0114558058 /NCGR_PEP_ID=MMETSP0114-20121206/10170_1 /TAXON_ID=31324 /ORGANISM="Goniomonas sp, Strain m" /LENGTH=454 /DNA_ID=CAMNT_0001743405 /DNA_START=19 /DNA_END=1383 /DNA_ORIENTATION=+
MTMKRECKKRCDFGARPSVRTAAVKDSVGDMMTSGPDVEKPQRTFKTRRPSMDAACLSAHNQAHETAAQAKSKMSETHVVLSDNHVEAPVPRVAAAGPARNQAHKEATDLGTQVRNKAHASGVMPSGKFQEFSNTVIPGSTPRKLVATPGRTAAEKVQDARGMANNDDAKSTARKLKSSFNQDHVTLNDASEPSVSRTEKTIDADARSQIRHQAQTSFASARAKDKGSHVFDGHTEKFDRDAPVAGSAPKRFVKKMRSADEQAKDAANLAGHAEATGAANRFKGRANQDNVNFGNSDSKENLSRPSTARNTQQDENAHKQSTQEFMSARSKSNMSSVFSSEPEARKRPLRVVNEFKYERETQKSTRTVSEQIEDTKRMNASKSSEDAFTSIRQRQHTSNIFAPMESKASPEKRSRIARPTMSMNSSDALRQSSQGMELAQSRARSMQAGSGPLW